MKTLFRARRAVAILGLTAAVTALSCGKQQPSAEKGPAVKSGQNPPAGGNWIAGTKVSAPVYDPESGGWDTEQAASVAGAQLKALALAIDSNDGWAEIAVWLGEDLQAHPLTPSDNAGASTAYDVDSLVVRRWEQPHAIRILDVTGFLESLKQAGEVATRTQIKVVGISRDADTWRTELVVHHTVTGEGESTQWNGRWACVWREKGENLTMHESRVMELEAVSLSKNGPAFADCTAAVFDGVKSFDSQLVPSIDHWLGRVDSRHGIDVGGWQGVAIADVNGDGLEDLYTCQPGGLPNRLFLQNGDGTLKDISHGSGTDWLESTHGALFADLDNDGDQDLLVGLPDGVASMKNDGKGVFSIRSMEIIPGGTPYSLAAADYDVDGDVDVFVCCYNTRFRDEQHLVFARPVPYHDANNGGKNALLQNDGGGSFRHATVRTGLDENNQRFSYAAAWEDFDNDGDLDLYVANDFGKNSLYRNETGKDGFVKFRDVAAELGVEDIGPGMSAAWGDWNNDGYSDLYVSNMFSSAGNRIATQGRFLQGADEATKADFRRHARGNTLFSNKGGTKFDDVSVAAGVNVGRWAWGSLFADFNNDGWQDIAVANGFITQADSGDL